MSGLLASTATLPPGLAPRRSLRVQRGLSQRLISILAAAPSRKATPPDPAGNSGWTAEELQFLRALRESGL